MKAIYLNKVLAESTKTIRIDGFEYFPPNSVFFKFFKPSSTHTEDVRKGRAHYYHIKIEGIELLDSAWFFPSPRPRAEIIAGYVAFGRTVQITK